MRHSREENEMGSLSVLMAMTAIAALLLLGQNPTLSDCRGKGFSDYEKLFREKPESSSNVTTKSRIYRTARFGTVSLSQRTDSRFVDQVTLMMPKHSKKTWQQILSIYGLSPAGATVRKTGQGRYTIITRPPLTAGWAIEWNPGRETDGFDRLTVWIPTRVVN